jgi:hypothetical protein
MRAAIAVLVACFLGFAGTVAAASSEATPSSQNYMITEPQFGTGSSTNDCSASYCANTSAGDTAIGRMMGNDYQAQAGGATSDEPVLEIAASGGIANLGTLDPTKTASLTMAVSVRTYLTGGYVVQITGDTPGYGLHQLSRLETPTASRAGAEQFGINLVANKTPALGANPVQVPSDKISFGKVASNYASPDMFMYKDGDVVAYSETDSGRTDYTISMILNISNTTPKGWYISVFSAVVVPAY